MAARNTLKTITMNKQTKTKKQRNTSTEKEKSSSNVYHVSLGINCLMLSIPVQKFIPTTTNNVF